MADLTFPKIRLSSIASENCPATQFHTDDGFNVAQFVAKHCLVLSSARHLFLGKSCSVYKTQLTKQQIMLNPWSHGSYLATWTHFRQLQTNSVTPDQSLSVHCTHTAPIRLYSWISMCVLVRRASVKLCWRREAQWLVAGVNQISTAQRHLN